MASYKEVFTITKKEDKSYWHRIGTAWLNKDGSINVQLDALPVNGQLNIRDPKPRDGAPQGGGQRSGGGQQRREENDGGWGS